MKIYTDINQSKVLAEILPFESADMYYHPYPNDEYWYDIPNIGNADLRYNQLPCWSLSALLDIYPMIVGRDMDMYCCWQNKKNLHSRHYDNPIDACVEMIVKLKSMNLL